MALDPEFDFLVTRGPSEKTLMFRLFHDPYMVASDASEYERVTFEVDREKYRAHDDGKVTPYAMQEGANTFQVFIIGMEIDTWHASEANQWLIRVRIMAVNGVNLVNGVDTEARDAVIFYRMKDRTGRFRICKPYCTPTYY